MQFDYTDLLAQTFDSESKKKKEPSQSSPKKKNRELNRPSLIDQLANQLINLPTNLTGKKKDEQRT